MGIISTVIPLIIIVILFVLIVRIATVVLKMTGLDEETAWFQSVSAFTGTGFTTKEAEPVLEDDIRRKTVIVLMILGRIGFVSVIAGLFVSFGKDNILNDLWKALLLILSIALLYKATTLREFSVWLNRFIEKRIVAKGLVEQQTLEELFRLPKGYGIAQLTMTKDTEELGQSLSAAGFIKKDILVLSIQRENRLIAFPHADDVLEEGDKLLCYGLLQNIKTYA
ncbi:MAG: TrkA C-terminal domain-containing protein [Candidatus Omnitrophica bacterium]|nr:TrkA C-terminal domain-containing protein [Candidatus Omnitrophota bacterium]